jgi:hypothetical protein
MLGLLGVLIIGLIVGAIAKLIVPGKELRMRARDEKDALLRHRWHVHGKQ